MNYSKSIKKTKSSKIIFLGILFVLLIISQTGCGKKEPEGSTFPIYKEDFSLDTICRITVYAMDESISGGSEVDVKARVEEKLKGAFALCKEYEALLSKTIETSDVSRINSGKGMPIECDEGTIELIQDGMQFGEISQGSFNIGLGSVTELWDFHAMEPVVPREEDLKEALKHVHDSADSNNSNIKIEGNAVSLVDQESKLDLGGIAKGYIADRIGEYLVREGVSGAVIDLGGNIVVLGHKPSEEENGEPQEITVGIKRPYTTTEIVGSIPLHDATVVTSGIYERYFEEGGVKYHHVLDPKTGYPADSGLESVTVIGELGQSEYCDALATIILIKGESWLREQIDKNRTETFGYNYMTFSDFTYILIDKEENIITLGNPQRVFTPIQ